MQVVRLNDHAIEDNVVAAIGFFDGVHLAHQTLLETVVDYGNRHQLKKAVISFDVHPKTVLFDIEYQYITPINHKIEKFKNFDIDIIYIIEFTKDIASMAPNVFIQKYLSPLNTLICGFDFRFGARASGTPELLKATPYFKTIIISEQTHDGYKIGSTHIRDLIQSGHVDQVHATLGTFYSIRGTVVQGQQKGRLLGYPTANIDTTDYLIPKQGVYASLTKVKNQWYESVSSVGYNPTLNCKAALSVESHIFNFDQMIYGEVIETMFIKRLRDELKFDTIESLIAKIDSDSIEAKTILKKHCFDLQSL